MPQESTTFSPFELLYGRQVRGPLDIVRETREADQRSSEDIISYFLRMREHLEEMTKEAQMNLVAAKWRQRVWYDCSSWSWEFSMGDNMLVPMPTSTHKLHAEWTGPYRVRLKVGAVNCEVCMPDNRKKVRIFHVNMLKGWYHAKGTSFLTIYKKKKLQTVMKRSHRCWIRQKGHGRKLLWARISTKCSIKTWRIY